MTDLVSRDELMKLWDEYHPYIATRVSQFDQVLRKLPSAYPKKGYWIKRFEIIKTETYCSYTPKWYCSECDAEYDAYVAEQIKFCPNCGADMRGESDAKNDNA